MSLKQPKDDASFAEWEQWDTEIRLRAWSQAYQCVPNYLLTRDQGLMPAEALRAQYIRPADSF